MLLLLLLDRYFIYGLKMDTLDIVNQKKNIDLLVLNGLF